jgi:hypothetical protein
MSVLEQIRKKKEALQHVEVKEKTADPAEQLELLRINKEKAEANNVDKWYDALKVMRVCVRY